MPTRRRGGRKPNPGTMAFGRNLVVLGSLVLALGAYGAVRGAITLTWPRTEATVTSADLLRQSVDSSRSADGATTASGNSSPVLFRSQVDGRDYIAGGVEPYDFGMQNS